MKPGRQPSFENNENDEKESRGLCQNFVTPRNRAQGTGDKMDDGEDVDLCIICRCDGADGKTTGRSAILAMFSARGQRRFEARREHLLMVLL